MAKVTKGASTMVWRISESSPMGEWVDLSAPPRVVPRGPLPADEPQGAWVRSSYDLLDGIDISDDGESVPAEIFDELFNTSSEPASKPTAK